MSLAPTVRDWRLASLDLSRCVSGWHVWALLGISDVRQRYKRSRFGQFWITLSMAVFVTGIGLVYGGLFHQKIDEYIPYLAVNMTVWGLISSVVNDSNTAFIEASGYLRQEALPKTSFVMRILVRNFVAFAHNLIIVPIVFAVFLVVPGWEALLAIPGLVLVLVAVFLIALMLGILSTRFRDLPQIVSNVVQLAFFITPVMWKIEQLGDRGPPVLALNPLAVLMRLVSEPLLGRVPPAWVYGLALLYVLLLAALSWPLFARFRARIVYWL